jgi:Ulp1 family protease
LLQVPEQTNNYDCGIYTIEYAERFIADPVKMLSAEYLTNKKKHMKLFHNETMARKRRDLLDLVKIFKDINNTFKNDNFKRSEEIRGAIEEYWRKRNKK